jgi:hypothetical protein
VRSWGAISGPLLLAGCATLLEDHYTHHRSFAEAYRSAHFVAIVPPSVQVMQHEEPQDRNVVNDDWSLAGYENVTRALEAEFTARGLHVAWVEPGPETAPHIASVLDSFRSLLPKLEEPGFNNLGRPPREFSIGNVGPLFDATGGDLLVVVLASSLALTGEDIDMEYLLSLATLGLHKVAEQHSRVRIAVVDRTGRIVCFGMGDCDGISLLNRKTAASAVARALEEIPMKK